MRRFVGALLLCCALLVILVGAGCASGTGGGITSSVSSMTTTGGTSPPAVQSVTTATLAPPGATTTVTTVLPSSTTLAIGAEQSSSTTSSSTSTTAPKTKTASFESSIEVIGSALKAQMIASGSWKSGDPVSLSQLRLIHVSYWGFDSKPHTGSLVVNAQWAAKLCTVFRKLYDARFPIRSMNLIDKYGASDRRSMNADNTSAYNGRWRGGTTNVWSMHAYGLAVDINTIENPWVYSSGVSPEAGRAYTNRSLKTKGMIHAGDVVVQAFASIGWTWGGSWSTSKDYQHFSSNGQ